MRLLSDQDDLARALLKFDAGKAKTFDPNDRERLWAVIEAAFGTFDPFNKIVRKMFDKKLQNLKLEPAAATTPTLSGPAPSYDA